MSEHSRFECTILFEEELRLAARAFRAFNDSIKDQGDNPFSEESKELLWTAVEVASAALWDARGGHPQAAEGSARGGLVGALLLRDGTRLKRGRRRDLDSSAFRVLPDELLDVSGARFSVLLGGSLHQVSRDGGEREGRVRLRHRRRNCSKSVFHASVIPNLLVRFTDQMRHVQDGR